MTMAAEKLEPLAVGPRDGARLCNVSHTTFYKWMKLEGFPVVRIGGCVRIPVDALREWLLREAGKRD